MDEIQDKGWSPYISGALSGVVLVLSVLIAGKYFGASTTFVSMSGLIEKIFSPEHVKSLTYFQSKVPKIDWQFMFVVGVLIGAFISAISSNSFSLIAVPPMWKKRFGVNTKKRAIIAFFGGGIAMFGARLAGG